MASDSVKDDRLGEVDLDCIEQAKAGPPVAPYVPGSPAEKALLKKIDMRILPMIWCLYCANYLDRTNIGNAFTAGMQSDLSISSSQYSTCLFVFFISYTIFQMPSNYLIARMRPSLYLSALCVLWGTIAALIATTQSWRQVAGLRVMLGAIEAGFPAGVIFFLSSWYRKYELTGRFAIYYSATAVSSAFSGLLAGVIVGNLDGARGIAGWRWLFIIEGSAAAFLGMFTWLVLPDWPSTTSWLSDEEKMLAIQRLAADGLATTGGSGAEDEDKPSFGRVLSMVFGDWRVWCLGPLYLLVTGSQTINYFVPTLVSALGWEGVQGQYHTIPLYASALVFIIVFCYGCDYWKNKPQWIMGGALLGGSCFVVVAATTNHMIQYVFLIFGFSCIYALSPLTHTWVSEIIPAPAVKRGAALAMTNAMGNAASIYGAFMWPSSDAPRYIPGWAATCASMFALMILTFTFSILFHKYPHQAADDDQVEREWQNIRK